jgi:hypothetical protein
MHVDAVSGENAHHMLLADDASSDIDITPEFYISLYP